MAAAIASTASRASASVLLDVRTHVGYVARNRLDVGLQRRVVPRVVRRVVAHDVDDRDPGAAGVVEVCEPVAEPRSQVQQSRGGRVRHPCVAIGSPGRDALEQGQDRAHLRHRIQRGDEVDLRCTRVREARVDACVDERADQCLGAVGHQLSWQGLHEPVATGDPTSPVARCGTSPRKMLDAWNVDWRWRPSSKVSQVC